MDPDAVAKDIIGKSIEAVKEKYEPLGYQFYVVKQTDFKEDDMRIYYHYTFDVIIKDGVIDSIFEYNEPTDLEGLGGAGEW
jgi:nucleoside diphosphate kinase